MYAIHDSGKKVYVADFIVDPDMQNKHLGQAIRVKSAMAMQQEFPTYNTLG